MGDPELPKNVQHIRRVSGNHDTRTKSRYSILPYAALTLTKYLGAKGTLAPGTGKGGILVPAPGDTAHRFIAPNFATDIRGPCPGLNAAANHGFLARDGIVTFDELVAAQQNMYNVGLDLAIALAVFGVELDGDNLSTKLSLGCDATSRTSTLGLGQEPGLNGHNKFEADTSLTRSDYFLANGNNYALNSSLYTEMLSYCNGNCGLQELSKYRAQRWLESQQTNKNFFFGVGSLLLYGAASFLYELFPGSSNKADEATMASFFGVQKSAATNEWEYIGERAPDGWRNRVEPYDLRLTGNQIWAMYLANPVPFGGNFGPGNFVGLNTNVTDVLAGKKGNLSPSDFTCFLYQQAFGSTPSSINLITNAPIKISSWALSQLDPVFKNLGCPQPIY